MSKVVIRFWKLC